jgi:hypothetical protein
MAQKIDGILVDSTKLEEERCGVCKTYLILKTYLNLSKRERILVIACEQCGYMQPIKTLGEKEKYELKKPPARHGWTLK